jgi:CxxC motif-containing protein (DUF1111 family)
MKQTKLGLCGLALSVVMIQWLTACSNGGPSPSPAGPPAAATPEELGLSLPAYQRDGEGYFETLKLTAPDADRRIQSSYGAITGPIPGLTAAQTAAFHQGGELFSKSWRAQEGLGPLFNSNSCASCHQAGGIGGSGHEDVQRMGLANEFDPDWKVNSAQFYPMTELGGPVQNGGEPDGEPEPDAVAVNALVDSLAMNGIIVGRQVVRSERITPTVAGNGLLSAVPDATILARASLSKPFGITGRANVLSGNLYDIPLSGRVGRLGHKAQLPDNESFFADAAMQELGLSNPHNPFENVTNAPAIQVAQTDIDVAGANAFMAFCSGLAPTKPAEIDAEGRQAFYKAGCAVCHYSGYWTAATPQTMPPRLQEFYDALGNKPVPGYTDLLVHKMAKQMADGFVQGSATGAEWRTAPLWGLRYKAAFMHDAEAYTLEDAIAFHQGEGSEANEVVANYQGLGSDPAHNLTQTEREALIRFLKKL